MRNRPERQAHPPSWHPDSRGEAAPLFASNPDEQATRIQVRPLVERHRSMLTALLEREPGHSLFLAANLARFSLDASFVRCWGIFDCHQLLAALMLVGRHAMPYAPSGIDCAPLARLAADEGFDFTLGRADLVASLLAFCPPGQITRQEEHQLATVTQLQTHPQRSLPPGTLVRRAGRHDLDGLTELYLGSDGFEGLGRDELRLILSGRVQTLRTYVLERHGRLLSAASTSGEAPRAAMIGGVWTAPEERNCGFGTAVVSALSHELLAEERRPYLFHLLDNAPATAVYTKIGFRAAGRWRVAYLSNQVSV